MPDTGEVTADIKGKTCDVEWKLNFNSLPKEINKCYSSPRFSFQGESWYFVIWPYGNKNRDSLGYTDLLFFQNSSNGPPLTMEVSLALKSVNGHEDLERSCIELFKGKKSKYYIHRLISISDFQKRKSEYLTSGFLTIVCKLRVLNTTGNINETFEYIINKQKDVQVVLEKTLKEKDAIKIQLEAFKVCSKIFLKEKLDMEADLKAIKEKLEFAYCKKCAENFSTKEMCMNRPVKCPECSEVVLLRKWHDHECRIAKGGANSSESSKVCHHDKILRDFKQLYLNRENCDVILRMQGQEFHAHKAILVARSPVFASSFRNDMREKETGIVEIENCDPSILPEFLCFLYSDDVDSLSEENVFGLFTAADKYDVPDLRRKCLDFMSENLSIETFCETITLALQHCKSDLIRLSTDFFIKNAEKILLTVKWQSFVAEHPAQSNELFIKFVTSVRGANS